MKSISVKVGDVERLINVETEIDDQAMIDTVTSDFLVDLIKGRIKDTQIKSSHTIREGKYHSDLHYLDNYKTTASV